MRRQYVIPAELPDLLRDPADHVWRGHTALTDPDPEIVEQYPGGKWRLWAKETGHFNLTDGSATVICGPTGRPLEPIPHRPNEFQGQDLAEISAVYFESGACVVSIQVFELDEHYHVTCKRSNRKGFTLKPGEPIADHIGPFHRFTWAVAAAMERAQCRLCFRDPQHERRGHYNLFVSVPKEEVAG